MSDKTKRGWIANLFPVEHDFFAMLDRQGQITREGISVFADWLDRGEDRLALTVLEKGKDADTARLEMEAILVASFSTPIDRGDLYEISKQLDIVLDYARDSVREAAALEVLPPQPFYPQFGEKLREGMNALSDALAKLGSQPVASEAAVRNIRKAAEDCREIYFETLSEVSHETDVNLALRRREIYHHLRDAGVMMDRTTDVLHRIIVKLL